MLLGVEGSQAEAACAVAGVVAPVVGWPPQDSVPWMWTAGLCWEHPQSLSQLTVSGEREMVDK